MYTTKVEGRHTKASGQYCHGLACAILEGLREEARLRNPQRFQVNNEVYYAAPTTHEEDWSAALDEAEKRFENTSKRPLILSDGDILYQQVQELVPWKLSRIQLAWLRLAESSWLGCQVNEDGQLKCLSHIVVVHIATPVEGSPSSTKTSHQCHTRSRSS